MKLFVITGTNKGLGLALTKQILLESDENLILAISRSETEEQKILRLTPNPRLFYIKHDLNDFDYIESKISAYVPLIKSADVLFFINNAGVINPIGLVGTFISKDLTRSINVNALAPAMLTNYLLSLRCDGDSKIINISTGAATKAIEGWSLYGAGKAFAKAFFDTLEKEAKLNPRVKVLSLDPGVIDTDMQKEIRNTKESAFPKLQNFVHLKEQNQLLTPEDAAAKILLAIRAL